MKHLINNYISRLKSTLDSLSREEIETFIKILIKARNNENTIYIMGNGGSAATASHFLGDIVKEIHGQKRFKIVCLNDNIPLMMAYANDVSFDDIFIEQLKLHLKQNDIVIGISGSGNSKNINKAIEYANDHGAITVGLTGYGGGRLKSISQYSVNANYQDMQISQDVHMIITHLTMQVLIELCSEK